MAEHEDIIAMFKRMEEKFDDSNTKNEENLSALQASITAQVDKKLQFYQQAVWKEVERGMERKLEDVYDRIALFEENSNGGQGRRDEIREGKKKVGTPYPTPTGSNSNRGFERSTYDAHLHRGPTSTPLRQKGRREAGVEIEEEEFTSPDEDESHRVRTNRRVVDDDTRSLRLTIPTFRGSTDPNEFLEWKSKTELVFACNQYSERKKVQVAICEFKEYALIWWEKIGRDLERMGMPPIQT